MQLLHSFSHAGHEHARQAADSYWWPYSNMPAGWRLVMLALLVLMIAALWRVFTKAGRPGWAALVPIYNSLQIIWTAKKPWWYLLLYLIPFVNIVMAIIVMYNLAKAFGKGLGYTLLLLLLPFVGFPMLAWGDAKYQKSKQ